jgi:hypothetical protein
MMDTYYSNRVLLADTYQRHEDAVKYFGGGRACQMVQNSDLMLRMYISVAHEARQPILEIIEHVLSIPDSCQWVLFLRDQNHISLDMLGEDQRKQMYEHYAPDPQMRRYGGICRRLCPMMSNNINKVKLMNALLLSMPGSPVIYYGDEIGMGDNMHLGDRNSVRTPMQWEESRNGGFSKADASKLFLPPITDMNYHYLGGVSVEAQEANAYSLLRYVKRLLATRKSSNVFGRGTLKVMKTVNAHALAFLRELDEEAVLCVFNLSSVPQQIKLDLSPYKGRIPEEMMHGALFSPIGERPYSILLSSHAFFWINISPSSHKSAEIKKQAAALSEIDFRGDDLSGVDLAQYPNLQNSDLSGATLKGVNLARLDLSCADLRGANLVDTNLDGATISGAKLWGANKDGWSIKDIVCDHIFWDREGREPVQYAPGEFERLFGCKGARVFLSSTVSDLQGYRDAVYKAIANLEGFECIRMEDFGAIGEVPLKVCLDRVRECDVFLCILGHYYGSNPPGEYKSFTEYEYDAAAEKPRLVFLADDSLTVSAQLIKDLDSSSRQATFRNRVRQEVVTGRFGSLDTLIEQVVTSLKHWRLSRE